MSAALDQAGRRLVVARQALENALAALDEAAAALVAARAENDATAAQAAEHRAARDEAERVSWDLSIGYARRGDELDELRRERAKLLGRDPAKSPAFPVIATSAAPAGEDGGHDAAR